MGHHHLYKSPNRPTSIFRGLHFQRIPATVGWSGTWWSSTRPPRPDPPEPLRSVHLNGSHGPVALVKFAKTMGIWTQPGKRLQKAIENCHRNSEFSWVFPLNMVDLSIVFCMFTMGIYRWCMWISQARWMVYFMENPNQKWMRTGGIYPLVNV